MIDIQNLLSMLGQVDAVKWLKQQPDCSIDLMITNIPYESLEKHRKIGTTTCLKNSKASIKLLQNLAQCLIVIYFTQRIYLITLSYVAT
ncbi:site-specific DNA-methyltransferase [Photobacterium phosphoreum]|uniref:site-specific DNA-methyltransferase n=1 Tax=Photobacterium phosphoreum TaxID=659 RepID=UPI0019606F4B